MIYRKDGKLYADTQAVQDSQKVPGSTLKHMGFGEFYLQTPVGRVDFDRIHGKDFEGQSGRSHLVYGDEKAVALFVETLGE